MVEDLTLRDAEGRTFAGSGHIKEFYRAGRRGWLATVALTVDDARVAPDSVTLVRADGTESPGMVAHRLFGGAPGAGQDALLVVAGNGDHFRMPGRL